MSDPFVAEIREAGFNFAPIGWALCAGQLLPISQNTALFSLIGVYYGGNGSSTFGLPDLRSRVAVGMGQGAGLPVVNLGEQGGSPTQTLNITQIPSHTHPATFSSSGTSMKAATNKGTSATPSAGAMLARSFDPAGTPLIYVPAGSGTGPVALGTGVNIAGTVTLAPAGGSQPLSIEQPYLAINMIIAMQGIYPPRS